MKRILISFFMITCMVAVKAVDVKFTTDETFTNHAIIQVMENNLSQLLTEINAADRANRDLDIRRLKMNDYATEALLMLWANIHFYCDDEEVVDRCWAFKDGYMVRQIPMIINPGPEEEFGSGTFQEVVVEFDTKGVIKDFRFALDAQLFESMEHGGNAVSDVERRVKILEYVERFKTAYNTKDMAFMQQVFSDDALIITGKTVMRKQEGDNLKAKFDVVYTKQTKQQYLENLSRAFRRNKYIRVNFFEIGEGAITQSANNKNMYGVRLRQEWRSSTYSDDGYVFLLWDFTDENAPVIHVRTWQPTYLPNGKKLDESEIFSLSNIDL